MNVHWPLAITRTKTFPLRVYPVRVARLGFLLLAASCTSTGKTTIFPGKEHRTTEQLLQLPIQLGNAGVNQVVRDLQRRYGVDAATGLSALTNAGQPITLEDGTVITRALTGTRM